MLYATCPTCNNLLADKQIFFEKEKEKIENDKNLSKKDREKEIEKLLDKIGLVRYCCRMRMITYLDQVNIII
jgi:DNA-directed RNA polymerase subunit N (RpoN/RPB10)